MHEVETFEHWGVAVTIYADPDAGNPYREHDYASELIALSTEYRRGVVHDYDLWDDIAGDDDYSAAVNGRWLTMCKGYAVALPFLVEDWGSSGLRGYLQAEPDERTTGFVCVSREKVASEWPETTTIDGETFTALEMAERCARGEFQTFVAYIEGDVYGYVVAGGEPEEDSCWGFYGPGTDDVRQDARSMAEQAAYDRALRELTSRRWLLDPSAEPAALSWESFRAEREQVAA